MYIMEYYISKMNEFSATVDESWKGCTEQKACISAYLKNTFV